MHLEGTKQFQTLCVCLQIVAISIAVAYGIFISQFVAPWYGSQHALDLMSASLRATGRALTNQYTAFEEVSLSRPLLCLPLSP